MTFIRPWVAEGNLWPQTMTEKAIVGEGPIYVIMGHLLGEFFVRTLFESDHKGQQGDIYGIIGSSCL